MKKTANFLKSSVLTRTFSKSDLLSAIDKISNMSEKDMAEALGRGEGYGKDTIRNLKFANLNFKGKLSFQIDDNTTVLEAIYLARPYDAIEENKNDALSSSIYVRWDGKFFYAQY